MGQGVGSSTNIDMPHAGTIFQSPSHHEITVVLVGELSNEIDASEDQRRRKQVRLDLLKSAAASVCCYEVVLAVGEVGAMVYSNMVKVWWLLSIGFLAVFVRCVCTQV